MDDIALVFSLKLYNGFDFLGYSVFCVYTPIQRRINPCFRDPCSLLVNYVFYIMYDNLWVGVGIVTSELVSPWKLAQTN